MGPLYLTWVCLGALLHLTTSTDETCSPTPALALNINRKGLQDVHACDTGALSLRGVVKKEDCKTVAGAKIWLGYDDYICSAKADENGQYKLNFPDVEAVHVFVQAADGTGLVTVLFINSGPEGAPLAVTDAQKQAEYSFVLPVHHVFKRSITDLDMNLYENGYGYDDAEDTDDKRAWGNANADWLKRSGEWSERPASADRRSWGDAGMQWIKRSGPWDAAGVDWLEDDDEKRSWGDAGMNWIKKRGWSNANTDWLKRSWGDAGMDWIKRNADKRMDVDWLKRNWASGDMSWLRKRSWGDAGMNWIKRALHDQDKRVWGSANTDWIKRDTEAHHIHHVSKREANGLQGLEDMSDVDRHSVSKKSWGDAGMSWIKRDPSKKSWGDAGMNWIKRDPSKKSWGDAGMSWIKRDPSKKSWGDAGMSWIKRDPSKKSWGDAGMSWIKRQDQRAWGNQLEDPKRSWGDAGMSWIKKSADEKDKKSWGDAGMNWIKKNSDNPVSVDVQDKSSSSSS